MRTTVAQLKESRIPKVLGICADDPRVLEYCNEAMERLMARGKWVGTYQKYRICTSDGCLTWPRQILGIEAVSLCNIPMRIRNEWFEFLEFGTGLQTPSDCGLQLFDRGMACAFNDIAGTNKKIKVYADVTEDEDAQILLQGYDENGIWIRTEVDGEWVDGEYVDLAVSPGTLSTKKFSVLTGVQKPVTNGIIRLYEYNVDDTTQRAIAIYEPDETVPVYRRSLITGLVNSGRCCGASEDCDTKTVTVMAKLRFIPVAKDTDYLPIGNLAAIKDMVQSIRKMENNLFEDAKKYEASAINELERELKEYLGDGTRIQMTVSGASQFGQPVANLI